MCCSCGRCSASLPAELTAKLKEMANGEEAVSTGDKCVLIKERRVMVVGLLISEWRLLLDKQQTGPADRLQLISGVEEAVVRGLSQVEATPEMPAELKAGWNAWALKVRAGLAASSHTFSLSSLPTPLSRKLTRAVRLCAVCVIAQLCETEMGSPQLRTKCLLQKTVLLLQQQQHAKALDSAQAVLKLMPDCKHAMALLATAQHKTGKKKPASATLADLNRRFPQVRRVPTLRRLWPPARAHYRATGRDAPHQGRAETFGPITAARLHTTAAAALLCRRAVIREARLKQGSADREAADDVL